MWHNLSARKVIPVTPLEAAVQEILDKLEIDSGAALVKYGHGTFPDNHNDLVFYALLAQVTRHLKNYQCTMANVLKDSHQRSRFEEHARLRRVIKRYILDVSLKLYANLDIMKETAATQDKISGDYNSCFEKCVLAYLEENGLTLKDIAKFEDAKNLFMGEENMLMILNHGVVAECNGP